MKTSTIVLLGVGAWFLLGGRRRPLLGSWSLQSATLGVDVFPPSAPLTRRSIVIANQTIQPAFQGGAISPGDVQY